MFYIDKDGLDAQVEKLVSTLTDLQGIKPRRYASLPKTLNDAVLTNEYYKVLPEYLQAMDMALELRANVHGESLEQFNQKADSKFQTMLAHA